MNMCAESGAKEIGYQCDSGEAELNLPYYWAETTRLDNWIKEIAANTKVKIVTVTLADKLRTESKASRHFLSFWERALVPESPK
ncbi:hypothetical protein OK016_22265 [Vibrio chagasii]|nr:hypothetical protein [Vibrio chagasii]